MKVSFSSRLRNAVAASAFLALLGAGTAQAAFVDAEVPDNAYITLDGLDWAWGGPVTDGFGGGSGIDLSFQSAFGWRIPTADELVNAPDAVDFLFPGGNVPFLVGGGTDPISGSFFNFTVPGDYDALESDGACATAYFNTIFMECNWRDGRGQPFDRDWAGVPGTLPFYEQLFIRESRVAQVSEPGIAALIGFGLVVVALRRRTRGMT